MINKSRSETRILIANQNIKEKEFWLDQLAGDPVKSNFPFDFDHPKSSDNENHMGEVSLTLKGETFSKLMKLCNDSDYTLNAMLITAVKILLNKYTGSGDILIGTPIYKQQESADELINTILLLRTRFDDNITLKQLLLSMIRTIREATENYNYPLELLREKPDIASDHGELSLFDIAVLLENIHDKEYIRDLRLNMTFSFHRKDECIDGIISFNRLLYHEDTVQTIAGHYVNLAGQLPLNIDLPPGAIDILSKDQKHRLLVDFNQTQVDYPRHKTIHQLFEEQVQRIPDHTALEEPGDSASLTYSELNRQANRLAVVLRTRGVGADSIVGLVMDRSLDLVWGMLGILKAGGAYLPIDTGTPIKRIQMMLEDGGVNVLLTQSRVFTQYTITQLQNLHQIKSRPYLTRARPQIKDIEQLPLPDRSLVDYEKYNHFIGEALVKHCITLFATRGCPYDCAFCHKIWPKTHVVRSAENIFQEIQLYYKMGVRRFAILDDIFNLNVKNGRRLFEMILDKGLKIQIFFPNGLRGDILTEDYIDLMVEAGTTGMSLALETASPRLQKLIGKRLKLEKLRHNLEYICKKHPHVILELFSMLGFPTETKEEAIMTLDFIKSIKWLHFVYVSILKIYPNTEMEKLAIENGITREAIQASQALSYHELPETLPFDKNFVLQYQADYTNNYFLNKERLIHVLRHQLKIMTEGELVQKYSSYLPVKINSFNDLLNFIGITHHQLGGARVQDEHYMEVPDLNSRLKAHFKQQEPDKNALRVLLIDLSQYFSTVDELLSNLLEPPLGLIYLMTYLNRKLGSKVNGKIAKTRIDFNSYRELARLLEEFKPQVIGIRTLSAFKDFFHETVSVIRQLGCQAPIVAGGPYATSSYEMILQDRHVDMVVLGEGEETFTQLIEEIIKNSGKLPHCKTLKEIAGLAFIERNEAARDAREKFGCEVLAMDRLTDLISSFPASNSNPESVNSARDLAYVNYTSGSTGMPKGVLVMHRNVTRLVINTNFVPLNGGTCILQTGSPEFDASTFETWGSLLNGGKLVLTGNDVILDVENLGRAIIRHNVNTMWLSSPLFNRLVQQKSDIFAPLAYLVVGGDALVPAMINRVRKEHPHLTVVNGYGPTENATFSTTFRIDRDYEHSIPIGKPFSISTA
jgi:non-ribosomal peptide synthetase component F